MDESLARELVERHIKNLTAASMAARVPEMSAKFLDLSLTRFVCLWSRAVH